MRGRDARLVVVGGGVLGLAVAAEAADAGWRVTLLEREPALCSVASGASFAWANAHATGSEHHAALRREAIRLHAASSAAASEPWFAPMTADAWGTEVAEGGVVDVVAFAASHAATILAHSGIVRTGAAVASVRADAAGAAAVLDSGEAVTGERIVLAAGVGTAALLGGLPAAAAVPALTRVIGQLGGIARVRAPRSWAGGLVLGDELSVRPDGADGLVLQSLALERELADEALPLDERLVWRRLRAIAARHGIRLDADDLLELRFAHRPQPADGLPIVDRVDERVLVVLAHSGVTLAPALARLVAARLDGEPHAGLEPPRPPAQQHPDPH
ncbi:FAD-dependent oxidoreductase [Agrococcus jenensis]|uniref:Glycine/D-amino acid oxidase-like deaminating enzyme n=1 Tax=Agrococcus jenensis TaxID=46353 RepID=A0A3N2APR9_9MICO|nr:FAD-dependent oxidoreductase [Agrococcus jenensis]ROR64692.1 glycine/D-amino acid oxidase-like deaminating enzyme [Agrococcus jenensis]